MKEIELIAKKMQENNIEMPQQDDYISFSLGYAKTSMKLGN